GMAQSDGALGVGRRPAVAVRRAPAENERRLVESESGRVVEEYLAQPILLRNVLARDGHVEIVRDAAHHLAELMEAVRRGEALRLQDELVFAVLDGIERVAVRVGARDARRGG